MDKIKNSVEKIENPFKVFGDNMYIFELWVEIKKIGKGLVLKRNDLKVWNIQKDWTLILKKGLDWRENDESYKIESCDDKTIHLISDKWDKINVDIGVWKFTNNILSWYKKWGEWEFESIWSTNWYLEKLAFSISEQIGWDEPNKLKNSQEKIHNNMDRIIEKASVKEWKISFVKSMWDYFEKQKLWYSPYTKSELQKLNYEELWMVLASILERNSYFEYIINNKDIIRNSQK